MRHRFWQSLLIGIAGLVGGCASADPSLYPPPPGAPAAEIVVLNMNNWHTAVVVAFADLPADLRDRLPAFAGDRYLAFGWGDQDFFREDNTTALAMQALFYSRGSLLLVHGFNAEPEDVFAGDTYRIPVGQANLERTIDHVVRAFARDADGQVIDAGLASDGGRFYVATGRYAWNRTCNNWTAAALHNAGLPITPAYAMTARNVSCQIRQLDNVRRNGVLFERRPIDRSATLLRTKGGRP